MDRADNRCAEGATLTDMEATVGTYQLRSFGGEQSRSDCYPASPLVMNKEKTRDRWLRVKSKRVQRYSPDTET